MSKRAVITGIGLLTPLGNTPDAFFRNALQGKCCIAGITKFDVSNFPVKFAGEIQCPQDELPTDEAGQMSRPAQWSVVAAKRAIADAGLDLEHEDRAAIDVILGVSSPTLDGLTPELFCDKGAGMAGAKPATLLYMNPVSAAVQVGRHLQLHGEIANMTTTCGSSASAIGYAMRMIKHGDAECVITGGADEGVAPLFMGTLGNSSHLSHRNVDPARASRPFDRQRDGYVVADAAVIFVIEEYERAAARNARIYCEVAGFGGSSDACSVFKLDKSEASSVLAMEKALKSAAKNASGVDFYSALGISMPFLDIRETRMLKRVFGDNAKKLPASSIKSMMGHPLGASGAVQSAVAALAIKNKAIPPTINYEDPDPECDLDYVPNEARDKIVKTAMTYNLGNGGTNTALVFSEC
jgi:3-oxoacyl-[acyl-carrier-protein] synthase II